MTSQSIYTGIARKGVDLDLSDISEVRKPNTVASSLFTSLFINPFRTLSLLILIIALPLSIYATLSYEPLLIQSEAAKSTLEILRTSSLDLTSNQKNSLQFEVHSSYSDKLSLEEISIPSYLSGSGLIGSEDFYSFNFTGIIPSNVQDSFSIVVQASPQDVSSEKIYAYEEFRLTKDACGNGSIWARNPVGNEYLKNKSGYCREFDDICYVAPSWSTYSSQDQCLNTQHAPEFLVDIEDEILTFEVDCDGNFHENSISFKKNVLAKDIDGDIVQFSVLSESITIQITQDPIKAILKETLNSQLQYKEKEYSAKLRASVMYEDIGISFPVTLQACDLVGVCSDKTFQVHVIQRSACNIDTKKNLHAQFVLPQHDDVISGISDILVALEGSEKYFVRFDLLESDCSTYIKSIEEVSSLYLEQNSGYVIHWDSHSVQNAQYCLRVLARDSNVHSPWVVSDELQVTIQNNSHKAQSSGYSYSVANLTTGTDLEYALGGDEEVHELSVVSSELPDWITLERNILKGMTDIPGTYICTIGIEDQEDEIIIINVNPPQNAFSNIRFTYPVAHSVLGQGNIDIQWTASDSEDIFLFEVFYSRNGSTWERIGSYPSHTETIEWDTTNVTPGEYVLKIVVTDGSSYALQNASISDPFYITSPYISGTFKNSSYPSLNNVSPRDNVKTASKRPLISASFHPSAQAEITNEGIRVLLDQEDITESCSQRKQEVICLTERDMQFGKHRLQFHLLDSLQKRLIQESYFTIIEAQGGDNERDETQASDIIVIPILDKRFHKATVIAAGIILIVALLLISIPWMLYVLGKRLTRKRKVMKKERKLEMDEQALYTPPSPTAVPLSELDKKIEKYGSLHPTPPQNIDK